MNTDWKTDKPSKAGNYLVTFRLMEYRCIECCYFDGERWDKGSYDEVLAWMELPEIYRG